MKCDFLNGNIVGFHQCLMTWIYICVGFCLLCTATATEDVHSASQVTNIPPPLSEGVTVTDKPDVTATTHTHELQPSETSVSTGTHETVTANGHDEQVQSTSATGVHVDQSATTIDSSMQHDSTTIEPSSTESPAPMGTSQHVVDQSETVAQYASTDQSESLLDTQHIQQPKESTEEPVTLKSKTVEIPPAIDIGVEELDVNKSTLPEQPYGQVDTESVATQTQDGGPSVQLLSDEATTEGKTTDKEIKSDDLTFNEWTQKVLAEAEKVKHDAAQIEMVNVPVPPAKQRKKKNYALHECGAKVLASNPEAVNAKSILNSNKDDYMINPCTVKKWVVIELCEPIQAHSIEIASLELFSSQPKFFKVFLSDRFPTKDWKSAGEFETSDERTIQTFPVKEVQDYFAKFVKVELVEHFGEEHFCPVTLFRVYGIAVVDYEDEDNTNPQDDDDDDDDEMVQDDDTETKNLFISAKDTVLNIVKKVLNVEPKQKIETNVTEQNATLGMDLAGLNGTVTDTHDLLPCLPDADSGRAEVKPEVANGEIQPRAPEPGKTDVIVTKLEDHEQIETVNRPLVSVVDDQLPFKTAREEMEMCLVYGYLLFNGTALKSRKCSLYSTKCEFLFLVFGKSVPWCKDRYKRDKDKQVADDADKTTNSIAGATSVFSDMDKSSSVSSKISASSDTKEKSVSETQSKHVVESSQELDTSQKTEGQSKQDDSSQISTSELSIKATTTTSETQPLPSSIIKATPITVSILQTDTPVTSASPSINSKIDTQTVTNIKDSVVKTDSDHAMESVKIDPSPTSTILDREITQSASSREATPDLPKDWKPDLSDLMETRTETGSQVHLESSKQEQTQKFMPETTSIVDSAVAGDSTEIVGHDYSQLNTPTVAILESENDFVLVDTAGQSKEEEARGANHLADKTEAKSMEDNVRQNLDLVRVPIMTTNKRESAIMRLSNRIKVLEQNVSLSSRFLEELSRRYKKQSEDMMKMLNRTVAKLNNMTVESEVKSKIHDDEMSLMGRRLENLTALVTQLSSSLQVLNKQVTDRQMIWTSIEIVIILFMVVFLIRRKPKETLPPEIRSLIESMPTKPGPAPSLSVQRRNSLSGPSTPSKMMTKDKQTLNKFFSSETNLVHSDYTIIHPVEPTSKQATDGVKKKKKKKQKNLEAKYFGSMNGDNSGTTAYPTEDFGSRHSSVSTASSGSCTAGLLFRAKDLCQNIRILPSGTSNEDSEAIVGFREDALSKQRANSDIVMQGATGPVFGRKPPIPKNVKQSHNGANMPSDNILRTNKSIIKGHKRQRSLPKQNYLLIETVGSDDRQKNGIHNLEKPTKKFDPDFITNIPDKDSLKKSNSTSCSSSSEQDQLAKKSDSRVSAAESDSTTNIGTPSPGARNKKLPLCGVQALYYGSEDQMGRNHSEGSKSINRGDFSKGGYSHITNGLDPGNYELDPAQCQSWSNGDNSPMGNGSTSFLRHSFPEVVNGDTVNGDFGHHDNMNGNCNEYENIDTERAGKGPETKHTGSWKKIFGYFK